MELCAGAWRWGERGIRITLDGVHPDICRPQTKPTIDIMAVVIDHLPALQQSKKWTGDHFGMMLCILILLSKKTSMSSERLTNQTRRISFGRTKCPTLSPRVLSSFRDLQNGCFRRIRQL